MRKFPMRAIHTPPFRSHGMAGNRLFNHTPSTKEDKTRHGRWDSTKQLYMEMRRSQTKSQFVKFKYDLLGFRKKSEPRRLVVAHNYN